MIQECEKKTTDVVEEITNDHVKTLFNNCTPADRCNVVIRTSKFLIERNNNDIELFSRQILELQEEIEIRKASNGLLIKITN